MWGKKKKSQDRNAPKMKTMGTTQIREAEFQAFDPFWSSIPAEVAPAQELEVCNEPGKVGWVGHEIILFKMG